MCRPGADTLRLARPELVEGRARSGQAQVRPYARVTRYHAVAGEHPFDSLVLSLSKDNLARPDTNGNGRGDEQRT